MTPAERAARITHLHRRMQIERAALDRAARALADPSQPPEVRRMRALYELAKAADRLTAHETTSPTATARPVAPVRAAAA